MDLPEKYPREHYQRKAARYAAALRLLFNAKVDPVTQERWSDLIALARTVDTYLDEDDANDVHTRIARVTSLIEEPSEEIASHFPALTEDQLGEETYARMQQLGRVILRVNEHVKDSSSLHQYALHRRLEGNYYARLISSAATPQVAKQPGYQRFGRWLLPTGEVTNLINSVLDLGKDYANGEIAFASTGTSRMHLLGHAALAAIQAPRSAK